MVAQAQDYLNQQLSGYSSRYGSQITDLVAQLQNRPAFEYNVETDPLYLQLRDIWKQDGLMAMEDTMGQAAQLTGGYGNSYAQTAGQQVYNNYLRQVNEMIPDLKEAARADYDAETNALLQQYSMLMEQDSSDYSRWLDEINRQYQQERDALSDQRYDQEWAYQTGRDTLADQRYEEELAYSREQDQYNRQQDSYDRLLELIIATGYQPTAEELAAAGMTEQEAKAWRGYWSANQAVGGSSSDGGGYKKSNDPIDDPKLVEDDDSNPVVQNSVPTRQELGDPFQKEDYTHVYANCTVYAGNGASASELAAYIKQALNAGSITQEQYNTLMRKFGNLVDSGKGGSSSGSGGRGSGNNNRYNTLN